MTKKLLAAVSACAAVLGLTGCATTGAEGTAEAGGIGPWFTIIYLVVILAVMYFLMIRPEQKRKKKDQEMRNSLSIGDTVTSIGGIVGKVVDMKDDFITIETSEDRVRVELAKWGISSVGKKTEQDQQN